MRLIPSIVGFILGMSYLARDNLSQFADQAEMPSVPGLYQYNHFLVTAIERKHNGEQVEHILYQADATPDGWYHMRTRYIRLTLNSPYKVEPKLIGIAHH